MLTSTVILTQVKRKQEMRRRNGFWRQMSTEAVLQGAETQTLRTYVDRRQATVTEWVTTQPILNFCARDTGY